MVAKAPYQKTNMPLALYLAPNTCRPCLPSTCMMVFTVSTGVEITLHALAHADANKVLTPTGRFLVVSKCSVMVRANPLAAVSPNLLMGPWISAGRSPR